ncbi:hypothetical protein FI667_g13282, partial [Globisporangium splendens]
MWTEDGGADDGAEAMLSVDAFKQEMFRSLREEGTVEMIREEGKDGRNGDAKGVNAAMTIENPSQTVWGQRTWSGDEKLVNGLLFDYFVKKDLEHTAAVFVPEIGGIRKYVAADTILQTHDGVVTKTPLVVLLMHELSQHLSVHTMESGTQTALDCFDNRFALENQLRRVETAYLTECALQKQEPEKSIEGRMLQYQREYDELCEKRLQAELERFETMELAMMRVEERKKYEREADKLRASLLQEHRQRTERLQETERDLELSFVAKQTQLEASLFETRQSLFQEMEKLQVKEAQLQVKVETDFRDFAAQTKRLQVWEENLRTQEANVDRLIAQSIREKEQELQLERSKLNHGMKIKEDELVEREAVLASERDIMKNERLQHKALRDEISKLEDTLSATEQSWKDAQKLTLRLEQEKERLEDDIEAKGRCVDREKQTLQGLSASNARLEAERDMLQHEIERQKVICSEQDVLVKQLSSELKETQQQLLSVKMDEATALANERKRFMTALDEERERFSWKENELLGKLRDLQTRLAESEAAVEKYHAQYEDEKLHVESLRQEVTNLNALLTQAQVTINAKHGTTSSRDLVSQRSNRFGSGDAVGSNGNPSGDFGSDRMLMMRMMEMMDRLQNGNQYQQNMHSSQRWTSTPGSHGVEPSASHTAAPLPTAATTPSNVETDQEEEEDREVKENQRRIERELLEQREYKKRRAERLEQEEKEIAERKRQADEELERQRKARLEEFERLEAERRARLAEQEEKLQRELDQQRKALQDAADMHRKQQEERLAQEQRRLQEEQERQDRLRIEKSALEEELEAKKLQRQQYEAEEERLRKERREKIAEEEAAARAIELQQEKERAELAAAETARIANEEEQRVQQQREQEAFMSSQQILLEEKEPREKDAGNTVEGEQDREEGHKQNEESQNVAAELRQLTEDKSPEDSPQLHAQESETLIFPQDEILHKTDVVVDDSSATEQDVACTDPNTATDATKEKVAAVGKRVEEESERQQRENSADELEQELELSGGSFAESRYANRVLYCLQFFSDASLRDSKVRGDTAAKMTLDYEIRATRRPLPRQLDVSDWTIESKAEIKNGSNAALSSSPSRGIAGSSVVASAYPSWTPTNRYDAPANNQVESPTVLSSRLDDYKSESKERLGRRAPSAMGEYKSRQPAQRDDRAAVHRSSPFPQRVPEVHRERMGSRFANQSAEQSRNHELRGSTKISPLRYTAEQSRCTESTDRCGRQLESASNQANESPRGRRESKSLNAQEHDSTFFSPFRVRDSSFSSPASTPESEVSSFASYSRRLSRDSDSSDTHSRNSYQSSSVSVRGEGEETPRLRRTLFAPQEDTTARDNSSTRSSVSPPPSPSISELSTISSTPEREARRVESPITKIRSMSERREELYAFRKRMREVFSRVEEMVDAHRDFFKSDPTSGIPFYDAGLEQEAAKFADTVFADLATLCERFHQLTLEFQAPDVSETSHSSRELVKPGTRSVSTNGEKRTRSELKMDHADQTEDQESVSRLGKDAQSDFGESSAESELTDYKTSVLYASHRPPLSPILSASSSRASSNSSTPEKHERRSDRASTLISDEAGSISTMLNARLSEFSSDFPKVAHQRRSVGDSDSTDSEDDRGDKDNVFKDFDKRMEEIRASLNSIASGRKASTSHEDSLFGCRLTASSSRMSRFQRLNYSRTLGSVE